MLKNAILDAKCYEDVAKFCSFFVKMLTKFCEVLGLEGSLARSQGPQGGALQIRENHSIRDLEVCALYRANPYEHS